MAELWDFIKPIFTLDMAFANIAFLVGMVFGISFAIRAVKKRCRAWAESDGADLRKYAIAFSILGFTLAFATVPSYAEALFGVKTNIYIFLLFSVPMFLVLFIVEIQSKKWIVKKEIKITSTEDAPSVKTQEAEFLALLEKAEQLLVGDTKMEQVTVLKTSGEKLYHCKDNPTKGDFSGTAELLETLRRHNDTQVRYIISFWNFRVVKCGAGESYPVDMISANLRHGLLELNPDNTEAMILFAGEENYNSRRLGSCLPPR